MIKVSGMVTLSRVCSCERCGKTFNSHHSMHLRLEPVEALEGIVNSTLPDIPVGWCMNGRDHLVCDKCMENES